MKRVGYVVLGISGAHPARAEVMAIPVLSHSVQAGQELLPADLLSRNFEVSATARTNFVMTADQAIGFIAAKTIAAGRPIPLLSVAPAPAVRKGRGALAHFSLDGIDIQGQLVPSKDAAVGEIVACRNPVSGLIVNALVLADGTLGISEK